MKQDGCIVRGKRGRYRLQVPEASASGRDEPGGNAVTRVPLRGDVTVEGDVVEVADVPPRTVARQDGGGHL